MLSNYQLQSAIIAYLKAQSAITDALDIDNDGDGADEIREDQWKGSNYTYPNIRVRLITNNPLHDDADCSASRISLSIMVFSEKDSSLECEQISGIIHTTLHGKSFITNGIAFAKLRTTNLIPAISVGLQTWRSECLMTSLVSGS